MTMDILPPALTKGATRTLETQARRHLRATGRNLAQFCADLRRLQDGGAHFIRGFDNFGQYATFTFEDVSPSSAKQFSRMGGALIALEDAGRISLDGHGRDLPGTTAIRALASILNQHGPAVMLDVYDRAKAARGERQLVGDAVTDAMQQLLRAAMPQPALPEPDPDEDGDDLPDDEDDMHLGDEQPPEPDEPEELHELRDRLTFVRGALDDLSGSMPALAAGNPDATRGFLRELLDEVAELQAAVDAAEAALTGNASVE